MNFGCDNEAQISCLSWQNEQNKKQPRKFCALEKFCVRGWMFEYFQTGPRCWMMPDHRKYTAMEQDCEISLTRTTLEVFWINRAHTHATWTETKFHSSLKFAEVKLRKQKTFVANCCDKKGLRKCLRHQKNSNENILCMKSKFYVSRAFLYQFDTLNKQLSGKTLYDFEGNARCLS